MVLANSAADNATCLCICLVTLGLQKTNCNENQNAEMRFIQVHSIKQSWTPQIFGP